MSRLSRAWRELRRPDPIERPETDLDRLVWYPRFYEIAGILEDINKTLVRMERRKRRPRIVKCEHPELHPDVEIGVVA